MYTKKFDESNFSTEVLASKEPVLVDIYADWCGPCRLLSPTVEEIAREIGENNHDERKVGKLNADENPNLTARYEVSSIPTLLLFKEGRVIGRMIGNHSKKSILEFMQSAN
ncbi:MAG TPA: thioredoxin [Candidatus Melainabacteria bacterium]|nr:thioredoxin [Candidatus Melainabacteria bacterium]